MYKEFFKFTFVRNPEARLISSWKDKVLRQNYFKFDKKIHQDYQEFDNFLSFVESLDITNCDEHLMSLSALVNFDDMDFIGKLESFDADASFVAETLGIVYEPKKLNTTQEVDLELTPEQRKRIYKIYKEDFDRLYPDYVNSI